MRRKSTTFTFRIRPEVKQAMELAAEKEHRTSGNLLEVLIIDHCEKKGIPVESTAPKSAKKPRVSIGAAIRNNR